MAILVNNNVVSVLGDNGYHEELKPIDCGDSAGVYIGMIHLDKIFINKKVLLSLKIIEDEESEKN